MVKCSVLMCFNSSHKMPPGITFHRFPKDEMLRKAWVKNLNRENWQPSTASLLCSKHFEAHLLDRTGFRTILVQGAIPTLFEESDNISSEKEAIKRSFTGKNVLRELQNTSFSSDPAPHDTSGKEVSAIASTPGVSRPAKILEERVIISEKSKSIHIIKT